MMICGLLGRHLTHSYSPAIHAFFGDYHYTLFDKQPEELEPFLRHGDFTGLNVTMPYKKAVIPFLDELTETAKKLGVVNTIVRRPDGTLLGHNTDYFGLLSTIERSGLKVYGKKCLVLGSGGASDTAVAVLEKLGAYSVVISRHGQNHYGNLGLHADAAVIINTTPVGMYPNCGQSPVDLSLFSNLEGVIDLVYNPARTKLLLNAHARGIVAINGLWMLAAQAKESAAYFTASSIDDQKIQFAFDCIRRTTENLILIGMPGCGKSTIGGLLAKKLGRSFVDIDAEIEKQAGKTIPVLFEEGGESAFRQLETQMVTRYGKESGLVIATGGGCVTQAENAPLLRQNGTIFCLQRQLALLPTKGRPLSTDLKALYAQRKPMYESFADVFIDNNGTPEDTIAHILEEMP